MNTWLHDALKENRTVYILIKGEGEAIAELAAQDRTRRGPLVFQSADAATDYRKRIAGEVYNIYSTTMLDVFRGADGEDEKTVWTARFENGRVVSTSMTFRLAELPQLQDGQHRRRRLFGEE